MYQKTEFSKGTKRKIFGSIQVNLNQYHWWFVFVLMCFTRAIFIAKLSKSQNKSFNFGLRWLYSRSIQPTTHPDKYEGDRIKQNLDNKSCLSIWVSPTNVLDYASTPQNGPIGAKNFKFICLWVKIFPNLSNMTKHVFLD